MCPHMHMQGRKDPLGLKRIQPAPSTATGAPPLHVQAAMQAPQGTAARLHLGTLPQGRCIRACPTLTHVESARGTRTYCACAPSSPVLSSGSCCMPSSSTHPKPFAFEREGCVRGRVRSWAVQGVGRGVPASTCGCRWVLKQPQSCCQQGACTALKACPVPLPFSGRTHNPPLGAHLGVAAPARHALLTEEARPTACGERVHDAVAHLQRPHLR